MHKEQEQIINNLRLCLYQSCTKQALEKEQIDQMDEYLNSGINFKNDEIKNLIKSFMKLEKPAKELVKSDQFLQNPFSFYSSYINLNLKDKETIIKGDLIKYYQSTIKELQKRLFTQENEIKVASNISKIYIVQMKEMSEKIDELKDKITDLEKELSYNKNRYEKKISDMITDFQFKKLENKNNHALGIKLLMEELKVRENIQFMMQKNDNQLKDEMSTLKNILMVPRLHYKYMENKKLEDWKEDYNNVLSNKSKM